MSGSTNIGLNPFLTIANIVAIYVFAGTIISEFFGNPNASIANIKASSPDATPTQ